MNDTVLLSTSRGGMIYKVTLLNLFCTSHGMKVNEGKKSFLVVYGSDADREQEVLHLNNLTTQVCEYLRIYISTPFIADWSTCSNIRLCSQIKLCHVLKFI